MCKGVFVSPPPHTTPRPLPKPAADLQHPLALVVEDDLAVRRLVSRMLAALGLDVVDAANGIEALALTREPARPIDLVVTDVRMPGMGGPQLALRLRLEHAGAAILFISGYPEDLTRSEIVDTPGAAVLNKPFSREELCERVLRMLGSRVSRWRTSKLTES